MPFARIGKGCNPRPVFLCFMKAGLRVSILGSGLAIRHDQCGECVAFSSLVQIYIHAGQMKSMAEMITEMIGSVGLEALDVAFHLGRIPFVIRFVALQLCYFRVPGTAKFQLQLQGHVRNLTVPPGTRASSLLAGLPLGHRMRRSSSIVRRGRARSSRPSRSKRHFGPSNNVMENIDMSCQSTRKLCSSMDA